jgi:hypothetical protein
MPVNFADIVYRNAQDVFGRPIVVTPLASQPGQGAYSARGIWASEPFDVGTEEEVIFSDMRTIVDILEKEFSVLPIQGDHISIPATSELPDHGNFVVIDADDNGEGERTLTLRRLVETKP